MVDRPNVIRTSGFSSFPLVRNQRMVVAEVGKSGSQSASLSLNQPCLKASWIGGGGSTWPVIWPSGV